MILVERARILRDYVELAAKRGESTPVDRVRVRGTVHVGARGVDRGVDHERGLVEERVGPGFRGLDDAMVVDEDEVTWLDQAEVLSL